MITLKTFEDLVFEPHPVFAHSKTAFIEFSNGQSIYVLGGSQTSSICLLLGNGITSFEVSCSDEEDVRGWQKPEEVTEQMIRLQLIK
jgi:hypothetical protein